MNRGGLTAVALAVAIGVIGTAAQAASAAPVVAAAGDIACDPGDRNFNGGSGTPNACRQRHTSDLLVNRGLAAVLALGDVQYEDAALQKFQASYAPTWGRVKSITRPVLGNHEYVLSGAAGYFDYFNGAGVRTGPAGDRLGGGFYSFDVGAWHLIALNSNCFDPISGCHPGSPQEQWLRRDLTSHPAACTLAFMHHPVFTSGGHAPGIDTLRPLFRALYDHGVEILLAGHDHNYERFAPQDPAGVLDRSRGVREFVVGTGGKVLYEQGTPLPNSEVRNDTSFGVLMLTLHPTSYEWQFVPAAGSTFTDAGSEACRAAPGYARPRSASRTVIRLVPASTRCTSPNAGHGPPLAAPACSPAAPASRYLTVGTHDLNGQPSGFRGHLMLTVTNQTPVDPADGDQADVKLNTTLDDVRRVGDAGDYTGQLQGRLVLRITDRANTSALSQPATTTDLPLDFAISCLATPAEPKRGSTCSLASSVDTMLAGAVLEGKRSVWEVKTFSVFDGGPDGIAATPGNTEFASPGLFVP